MLEGVFEDTTVEAFFFDDLERLPKKLRNVVLSLVRNGSKRLPDLKIVWAAVGVAANNADEFDPESVEPFTVTVEVGGRLHMP